MNFEIDPFAHYDRELHRWSIRYMWLSMLFIISGIVLMLASRIALGFSSWVIGQIVGFVSMRWHKRSHGL